MMTLRGHKQFSIKIFDETDAYIGFVGDAQIGFAGQQLCRATA